MATELFRGLAIGQSLEYATARARRHGLTLPAVGLDWASPAVWLANAPTANWTWGQAPSDPLLQRMIAWSTVQQAQKVPEVEEHDEGAFQQAQLWRDAGRVIVQAESSSEAVMMALGRVADAALRRLNIAPIFIRMRKASPIASIRDWAEEV